MNDPIDALLELEIVGYRFSLDGDNIHFVHEGDRPNPIFVKKRMESIQTYKEQVVEWLRKDKSPADIASRLFLAAGRAEAQAFICEENEKSAKKNAQVYKSLARGWLELYLKLNKAGLETLATFTSEKQDTSGE